MDPHIGNVVLPVGRLGSGGVSLLGTCFGVGPRKFATAAHVTGPSDEGLVAIVGRLTSLADYQDTTNPQVNTIALKIVNYDPIHDVSILEIVDTTPVMTFGYSLGSTDEVAPGTPVISLGFPHADHGRLVLTQQSSIVGARILLGVSGLKIKNIVLNTQTRPGQSGGPVFTGDGGRVCAMILGGYKPAGAGGSVIIAGIDPQTIHQTTHAVSAEYISELL